VPLLTVTTASDVSSDKKAALLTELVRLTADILGKSERYMMAYWQRADVLLLGGDAEPACHLELSALGDLTPDTTSELAQRLTPILSEGLGVAGQRIHLHFFSVERHRWANDGRTFA
jgi:phenylpyruvate tautomerase PptA (4-oxalocrotonate tautomerase family)